VKKVIYVFISIFILTITTTNGQPKNLFWGEKGNIEFGLDVSFRTALGFNFGYHNPEVKPYSISYISFYLLDFDGLQGKGTDYSETMNKGSFTRDIKQEGYSYQHLGIRVGFNTKRPIVPYSVIGYRRAFLIQNRFDSMKILSNSGNYHLRIMDNRKSKYDIGFGLKFAPTNNNFNFSVEYSQLKSITLVGNWSIPIK